MLTFSGFSYSAKASVFISLLISLLTVPVESQNSPVLQENRDSPSVLDILRQGQKLTSQNTAMRNPPSVQDLLRKGQTLRLGAAVEQSSELDLMNKIRQKFRMLLELLPVEAPTQNRELKDVRTPVNLNFAPIESTSTRGIAQFFDDAPKSENSQSSQAQPTGNSELSLGIIPPHGPQTVLSGPPKINNQQDFPPQPPPPPPPQITVNNEQQPDVQNETTVNQEQSNTIVLPDGTVLHSTSEVFPPPLETATQPPEPAIAAIQDTPPLPIDITLLDSPPMT